MSKVTNLPQNTSVILFKYDVTPRSRALPEKPPKKFISFLETNNGLTFGDNKINKSFSVYFFHRKVGKCGTM
jgi:hypothetical protein